MEDRKKCQKCQHNRRCDIRFGQRHQIQNERRRPIHYFQSRKSVHGIPKNPENKKNGTCSWLFRSSYLALSSPACKRLKRRIGSVPTAVLGATVAVFRALDTLLRPGETWQGYRKASENMKREYRLYINNADVYANASSEEAAYQLLVQRVESVLAEEQQIFWQFHTKSPEPQPAPEPEK